MWLTVPFRHTCSIVICFTMGGTRGPHLRLTNKGQTACMVRINRRWSRPFDKQEKKLASRHIADSILIITHSFTMGCGFSQPRAKTPASKAKAKAKVIATEKEKERVKEKRNEKVRVKEKEKREERGRRKDKGKGKAISLPPDFKPCKPGCPYAKIRSIDPGMYPCGCDQGSPSPPVFEASGAAGDGDGDEKRHRRKRRRSDQQQRKHRHEATPRRRASES